METLFQLYVDHALWVWLAIGMAILAVEVSTGSGWLLWPAVCAGVVALLSPFVGPAWLEIAIFAGLTVVTSLLARRYWPRTAKGADINDNVSRLIGHRGKAVQTFAHGSGRVDIDGKEWAADLDGAGEALPIGSMVEVTGLSGSRLLVRPTP